MKKAPFRTSKGFTLIELLVSFVIIVLALLGMLLVNSYVQKQGEQTFEKFIAYQDANRVIELMRNSSATGTFPLNVTTAYPNGGAVNGFSNLSGEQIRVTYTDSTADPLDIIVTTSWQAQGIRGTSIQLRTLMTKRS
ncbi:MAG: prepilin-type N-terminal cleavage/methylation domain-containing protein [Candidatus Omnitrophica bacterium]|nr:prepilin-type N-terminal cleavage/methylation domain-containing protein [Candidatus Omnitrophota bacterium]